MLIILFTILGAGIKYIDNTFDENKYDEKLATFIACILGLLMAYTIHLSSESATILLSMLIGLLIAKKIDNVAFLLGYIIAVSGSLMLGFDIVIIPFIIFIFANIIDEFCNDLVDKNNYNIVIESFFKYRFTLKVCVLIAVIFSSLNFLAILYILSFDVSYILIDKFT